MKILNKLMKKINKNVHLHPWKQIDWMACNIELLRLQAKLHNALKLELCKIIKAQNPRVGLRWRPFWIPADWWLKPCDAWVSSTVCRGVKGWKAWIYPTHKIMLILKNVYDLTIVQCYWDSEINFVVNFLRRNKWPFYFWEW